MAAALSICGSKPGAPLMTSESAAEMNLPPASTATLHRATGVLWSELWPDVSEVPSGTVVSPRDAALRL